MIERLWDLWRWFWSPSSRWALGGLLIVGGIGGILFWGAFNWSMEITNTEKFCISCHEMHDTV
ncbi:MAG: NapC/NirT family cytochrome c, partial [Geminicoccaceae bacterium]